MPMRFNISLLRAGTLLALGLVLASCTKGGQFDPTVLLDNDMFSTKTDLKGQRELLFPGGVPGVSKGIPADLYKGYQPPAQPATNDASAAPTPITPPEEAPPKPERKVERERKPRVARERPRRRTEIRVGLSKKRKPEKPQTAQTAWPSPTAQTQPSQTAWPAPPPTGGQSSQTAWPAPPPSTQQAAQPAQSIWPNPPATGAQ